MYPGPRKVFLFLQFFCSLLNIVLKLLPEGLIFSCSLYPLSVFGYFVLHHRQLLFFGLIVLRVFGGVLNDILGPVQGVVIHACLLIDIPVHLIFLLEAVKVIIDQLLLFL